VFTKTETYFKSEVFISNSYTLSLSLYESFYYYASAMSCASIWNPFHYHVHKNDKKDPFRISRIQSTLLQALPLLKLVCHREFLCTLWIYIWGSGGMAPLILIVGAGWRWVVDFTVRRLYPRGKTLRYTRIRGWLDTRPCLYKLQKRKPTWSYRKSNHPAA